MYSKEKQKPKKTHRNLPSFSSSLLDEICRSIDGKGESPEKLSNVSRSSTACLVDKWMENKEKAKKRENRDNDPPPFVSSNSSSSDSSGALSSSDNEFFSSSKNSNSVKRPKPVRTSVFVSVSPHPNRALFSPDDDDYRNEKSEEKAKRWAMKTYVNLKKLKQPISPGMKLTNLINSFFNRKKSKDGSRSKVHQEQQSSCVYKNPSNSCENSTNGTVRFDLVGKQKSIYDDRYGRPPLPPMAKKVEDRRKFDYPDQDEDGDEDDACSESSSDLFELDHLSLFGRSDEFCEELPVYKSTYIGKNRGLIPGTDLGGFTGGPRPPLNLNFLY